MINHFPRILAKKSMIFYILASLACLFIFWRQAMPVYLYLFGIISVAVFFFGSYSLSTSWQKYPKKQYEKSLFWTAFTLRLGVALLLYFLNQQMYGHHNASEPGDIGWYIASGMEGAKYIGMGDFSFIKAWHSQGVGYTDMGYCLYLSVLYVLSFKKSSYIVPLILKAIIGAYTCVLAYRVCCRHFGESTAKIAGIFCALQFNLIWWCASMMKETELTFLTFLFLDSSDRVSLGNKRKGVWMLVISSIVLLFLFRAASAIVAILSFILTAILSNSRIRKGLRHLLVFSSVLALLVLPSISLSISSDITENDISEWRSRQSANMQWRAEREGGNTLAKYAGAAVFAPMIFTLPFPTMVYTQLDQEMLMQVNGGNFTKNILSFFVILSLVLILFSGKWRNHVLLISFLCGYLIALVISQYAQSGRFHIPIMPLEMMFAAVGLNSISKKTIRWFDYFLILEFCICIAWSWFKLAGRGLV